MKRYLALGLSVCTAQASYWSATQTYIQKNPFPATLGALGLCIGARALYTIQLAHWAGEPERWSSLTQTVEEKIAADYTEPLKIHELAGYYAALADIDYEISCLLRLKAHSNLLSLALLCQEMIDQKLLALIAIKQEIINATTAVRVRLRSRVI